MCESKTTIMFSFIENRNICPIAEFFLNTIFWLRRMRRVCGVFVVGLVVLVCLLGWSQAELPHHITIDGKFDDWIPVRKYDDPRDDEAGTVLQGGTFDCHDTDSDGLCDHPSHVYNPHADLIEYAFTHDERGVYAYMKAVGNISLTSMSSTDAGRSYIQVMLDMDTYIPTGYCTNEGGYYPPGCGYDMHFELEMYNGTMNTAHVILHSMNDTLQFEAAKQDQINGIVNFGPATYKPYTEWVYWSSSNPPTSIESSHCQESNGGPYTLPNGDIICFVVDKVCPPLLFYLLFFHNIIIIIIFDNNNNNNNNNNNDKENNKEENNLNNNNINNNNKIKQ